MFIYYIFIIVLVFLYFLFEKIFFQDKSLWIKTYTINWELVKSKKEKIIADYFYKQNINYVYEKILYVSFFFWLFKKKISVPDFYLPDYDIYVEYFWLMDHKQYRLKNNFKISQYYLYWVKFISLYPYDLKDLDYNFKRKLYDLTWNYLPLSKWFRNYDKFKKI